MNLLYYPYINVPRTDWTLRTLLYYDNIGSIVPQEYFYNPDENYDDFMLELVQNELVTPINPMDVLDNPWNAIRPFLELIESNQEKLKICQNRFTSKRFSRSQRNEISTVNIHADKFDQNIFYTLEQLGLAERSNGSWYSVERKTAENLMNFLATLISAKTDRLPITDYIRPTFYKPLVYQEHRKRETILTKLIPFPEDIDMRRCLKFKEQHSTLLIAFRTRIEQIVLDPNVIEGSPLFYSHLAELIQRKEELTAKMNESQLGRILFGTVCGLIGAYQGYATASTIGAAIGGLPGFVNAVYSSLQIERAEDIFDQSGLKYLALADRRIRQQA